MTGTRRVDSLRERLLARELDQARTVFDAGGAPALIASALELSRAARASDARFARLSQAVEAARPADRSAYIAGYLRETVDDARKLAADLRALRHDGEGALDLAALGERNARCVDALECRAEACLAIAASSAAHELSAIDSRDLLELAETPGRFSRRIEALVVLHKLARAGLSEPARELATASLLRLSAASEQRWVQPVALFALAAIDNTQALACARERLSGDAGGEDFIVRSMILRLAARLRKQGWHDLVSVASRDPSELVRMTVARVELHPTPLAHMAQSDPSPKVRALALIRLAKRARDVALHALAKAVLAETHAFVVQTAVEEIIAIARRTSGALPDESRRALWFAARRAELPASVRNACVDGLLELDVLGGEARAVHALLANAVRATRVGGSTRVASELLVAAQDDRLARALALLARDDFALGVDRTRGGVVLYRGERRRFSPWRVLFETRHPAPSKRQAALHTLGRKPRGALRAPPGGLAEVTATRVPGERVLAEHAGDWGRHLPLVDDLLSSGVLRARGIALSSAYGVTHVKPAPNVSRRLKAWLALTFRYAHFAELRQRALSSHDREVQSAYAREVERETGISIEIVPYAFGLGPDATEPLVPIGLVAATRKSELGAALNGVLLSSLFERASANPDALAALANLWDDFANYALSPGGNRLPQLAAYALVLLSAMMARGIATRQRIEAERRTIPLVMGGWGTRGKSGTERLKAGMFHGLGYETLVKTTGCEAMFIRALPGLPAREVFIYRPYDKATVWEQRELLALAHRLSVRVFLWECMALQPDLVGLLQAQWMHDDCSTITNAYPDHEDIQGPTGLDVAATISEFVPTSGRLFTTEEQMLPVLQEQARSRGTKTEVVRARDAELIPGDLLARFSYAEHPKNVALVAALARSFGIPETVAIAEMADNVVPDLGALKTYPTVAWRERRLTFTNGMGANDREGTLGNWRRAGFATHDPELEPERWIVTVVNNRADRIARSEVFAQLIVEDVSAHRHVLIGTNVVGLLGLIDAALQKHIERSLPCRDLPDAAEQRRSVVAQRIARAFLRLKLGRTDAASVALECSALGFAPIESELVERLLRPAMNDESYEAGRALVLEAARKVCSDDRLPFIVSMIARRRCVRALQALAQARLDLDPGAVDAAFAASYRALFMESLLPLPDPALSGDAIIDCIALAVPSGAHASILGMQNIKGTGLDFVYRWVSIDMVTRMLAGLASPTHEGRQHALTQLMVHDDYGMLDATFALTTLERARAHAGDHAEAYDGVITRLRELIGARSERAATRHSTRAAEHLRKAAGEVFDFLDSVRRRRMASRVVNQLALGRISHASAALRMRRIVARSKGAWMLKPS